MDRKKYPELLAPAGSFQTLEAVIAAGADAVYLGGSQFGARAYAPNFTKEELLDAIDYAHLYGRRLYLTVNTLLKQDEMETLCGYLLPYYDAGVCGQLLCVFFFPKTRGSELRSCKGIVPAGNLCHSQADRYGNRMLCARRALLLLFRTVPV